MLDQEDVLEGSFAKLGVGDEDFLVASMIERCPKVMMLRELLVNAVEAASRAAPGGRRVEIGGVLVNGVRKLCLWNTGPGMDAGELFRMCDIASSIGKTKGLDRNFGMGAKVATLPSNQLGVRYRSCRDGRVHQVVLGKRDGVYGRLPQIDAVTGRPAAVVDVTAEARADGRQTGSDWTEVVLFGNHPDQDTLLDPYGRNPTVARNWIPSTVYSKLFRIDEGVELWLDADATGQNKPRRLSPLASRIERVFARHEVVTLPDGILVHYLYDPAHPRYANKNASFEDGLVPDASLGAVLHGGELYDLRRGGAWTLDAPSFGIPFGARHISVLVELSEEVPVRPDGYRQFLRYLGGVQDQVRLGDFSGLVRNNRPQWLRDLIDEMSPDIDLSRDISEQLRRLMAAIGLKRMRPKQRQIPAVVPVPVPPPATPPRPDPQKPEQARPEQPVPPKPEEAVPPKPPARQEEPDDPTGEMVPDLELAPELLLLREEKEIADRNLTHRAARYYPESHQLFVNMAYPSVRRLAAALQARAPAEASGALAGAVAKSVAEQDHLLRIGRGLVMGLGKRDLAQGWSEADKRAATSSETLTLAADDIFANRAELLERYGRELEKAGAELASSSAA